MCIMQILPSYRLLSPYHLTVRQSPTPTAPRTLKPIPAAKPSTTFRCQSSLRSASAYPTSGLKVTMWYKLVHPLTRLVGNASVKLKGGCNVLSDPSLLCTVTDE